VHTSLQRRRSRVFRCVFRCAEGAQARAQELEADAVVMAVGIAGLQKIVASSAALSSRAEFRAVANLGALDVLAGIDP